MKQRLDLPFQEKMKTMDTVAKTQEQKIVEKWLDFPFEERIETMDRLAIIQEQKLVETMVRFCISK